MKGDNRFRRDLRLRSLRKAVEHAVKLAVSKELVSLVRSYAAERGVEIPPEYEERLAEFLKQQEERFLYGIDGLTGNHPRGLMH